jgi:Tol biopolymer transport system component
VGDTLSLVEREKIQGSIVFSSKRDGNAELYRVRPTGTALRRMTNSPETDDFTGPLSPDGREMAGMWARRVTPKLRLSQLVVVPVAGGAARPVGARGVRLRGPSWSRDGRWLVYESDSASFRDLYRVDRSGATARLTNDPEGNYSPEVSPDGAWVLFQSSRTRDGVQIFRMRPDGSGQQRLTDVARDHWGARWSPDGRRIVFVSDRQGADRLWVMDADGKNQRRLTREDTLPGTIEAQPSWAPAGPERVAHVLRRAGEPVRIRIQQGDRVRQVPVGARGGDDTPTWSRDGRYLAFVSTRDGNAELYIARADGSRPTRLTRADGDDFDPVWVP